MNFETPRVRAPFCTQDALDCAAETLKVCYSKPTEGFVRPFFAPGGAYGNHWWSLDCALAAEGAKWLDIAFGADLIRNLAAAQCADGRIRLYGPDAFGHVPNVKEPVSSLPKYFETCWKIVRMTGDRELAETAYSLFRRSLDWWFRFRQDPETKLITAVFEETFIPNTVSSSMVYAPMDTNCAVRTGCRNTALLAEMLGDAGSAAFYRGKAGEIAAAVNRYLWNGEKKRWFPYVLPQKRQYPVSEASMFLGFSVGSREQNEALAKLLTDDSEFGWERAPLRSVSRKDPLYTTVRGAYAGNPSWSGSVWTLLNDAAVSALKDAGYRALSAELSEKTLCLFSGRCAEFINPETLTGEGVQQYAWTAAQFIRILTEELFGLEYTPENGLTAAPNVPEEYRDAELFLGPLHLPDGSAAEVRVTGGKAKISVG